MKTKVVFHFLFCCLLFCHCTHKNSAPKESFLHAFIGSLAIDKSKNILIYTINPNDCINCLKGLISINEQLTDLSTQKIIIVSVEREIEKRALIKSTTKIDLKEGLYKTILWDKNLFQKINLSTSVKKEITLSLLTVYNYKIDSVLYNKPIKEIIDVSELARYLEK